MAAQANITVYDGAATPIVHTLVPVGASTDPKTGQRSALWREALVTLPLSAQIQFELRMRELASGVIRTDSVVQVPVMESISGQNSAGYTAAPKVAYINTLYVTGFFSQRSTIAERRLARQIALNCGGNVATSVAAATSGFVPDLIDSLIIP